MKPCKSCEKEKPDEDFYSGQKRCKECVKARVRDNYQKNKSHYQEYERKRANLPHRVKARENYAKTDKGKKSGNRAKKKWLDNNALKRAAHILVGNAVRDGKIEKPDKCSECFEIGPVDGHHDDYEKPMDVRWLCVKCHNNAHNGE